MLGIFSKILRTLSKLFEVEDDRYYDGPAPTLEQRQDTWQWMVDHFQQFPESLLKYDYPHLYKVAMATKAYKELNLKKEAGLIDDIDYEMELAKILPYVDISKDLTY